MSTVHHDPIVAGSSLVTSTINSSLGQLDAAIVSEEATRSAADIAETAARIAADAALSVGAGTSPAEGVLARSGYPSLPERLDAFAVVAEPATGVAAMDTAMLQLKIDAVSAFGGGFVDVPSGNEYLINAMLEANVAVTLRACYTDLASQTNGGYGSPLIRWDSGVAFTNDTAMFRLRPATPASRATISCTTTALPTP